MQQTSLMLELVEIVSLQECGNIFSFYALESTAAKHVFILSRAKKLTAGSEKEAVLN